MTHEEIVKNNVLIAEFMGWKHSVTEGKGGINLMYFPDGSKEYTYQCEQRDVAGMKYHSSWDWLMPVVEKIENLKEVRDIQITCTGCSIFYNGGVASCHSGSKIETVYNAVVQFIEWYNNQNK